MITIHAEDGRVVAARRRTGFRMLLASALLLSPAVGWLTLYARYDSWHPCDWVLQDRVELILRRHGVDPDAAPIPLKAAVTESAEVRAVLQLRHTPAQCLSALLASKVAR